MAGFRGAMDWNLLFGSWRWNLMEENLCLVLYIIYIYILVKEYIFGINGIWYTCVFFIVTLGEWLIWCNFCFRIPNEG